MLCPGKIDIADFDLTLLDPFLYARISNEIALSITAIVASSTKCLYFVACTVAVTNDIITALNAIFGIELKFYPWKSFMFWSGKPLPIYKYRRDKELSTSGATGKLTSEKEDWLSNLINIRETRRTQRMKRRGCP